MSLNNAPVPVELPDFVAVISDLDGVVYRGSEPIKEAVEAFRRWHDNGIRYCFVTNNSTRSASEFAAKLRGFGIVAEAENVVTSADTTAALLKARWPAGARVFVVGATSLVEAIAAAGFEITGDAAEIVVAGLDRDFTYAKLKLAARLVLDGAALIGTNPDLLLPSEDGFEPGAGTLIGAIAAASGQQPLIIGKPEPHMIEAALQRLGTDPARTVMIGDQIATDIQAGQRAGLFSILVQTGVPETGARQAEPDLTLASLAALK
jgi:4-nitrophenyl phosphatase